MENDFVLDMNDEDLQKKLEFASVAATGSSAYRNDRERPYNGQPQTDHGERGKTEVRGLTIRDISDCFVQGFLAASGVSELADKTISLDTDDASYKKGDWRYEDVYKIKTDINPQAVIGMAMCFIEKYMGVFPNVGKIELKDILGEDITSLVQE
jgi:hypothetical protein